MHRPERLAVALLCAGLMTACAAAAPTATSVPPTAAPLPSTATSAPPTSTSAPAATAAPTASVAPTAAPPTTAPSPSPVPSPTVAPRRFVADKASKVTLRVNEQFANVQLPNDAELTAALTGEMTVADDGSLGPNSKFTADLSSLQSDDPDRDDDVKDNYLETKKFPTAVFVPKELRGLPKPAPASGPIKGQMVGDLTVHGVTRPATFDVDGTLDGSTFKGKAKTEMKITDYGMKVPTLAILLRVEDRVRVEIDLVATAQR